MSKYTTTNYSYNPYKDRRKRLNRTFWSIIFYDVIFVCFLGVLSTVFKISLDKGFFNTLFILSVMPVSIALVGLIPYICYIVYLTKRAKIYEEENINNVAGDNNPAEQETSDSSLNASNMENTDSLGSISQVQTINYVGHEERNFGPWGAIFMGVFVLPPVGLFMALRKAFSEPSRYLENSVVMVTVGKTVGVFAVLLTWLNYMIWRTADEGFSIPVMVYIYAVLPYVIAAALYFGGRTIRTRGRKIAIFQRLIWVLGVLDLRELGENLGLSYMETVRTVQDYINKGFLADSFIDYKFKTVVVPMQYTKEAVKCNKCGGTTIKVKGTTSVCSFCGCNI